MHRGRWLFAGKVGPGKRAVHSAAAMRAKAEAAFPDVLAERNVFNSTGRWVDPRDYQ
jgi:hypothetical protein